MGESLREAARISPRHLIFTVFLMAMLILYACFELVDYLAYQALEAAGSSAYGGWDSAASAAASTADSWDTITWISQICVGIVFIAWFYSAYKRLREIGRQDLRFGPGWAIGSWFVPILSFWRPKQIMNDIWRGTFSRSARDWDLEPVPIGVHLWWGAWLSSAILSYVYIRTYMDAQSIDDLGGVLGVQLAFVIVNFIAAALACWVVAKVAIGQGKAMSRGETS